MAPKKKENVVNKNNKNMWHADTEQRTKSSICSLFCPRGQLFCCHSFTVEMVEVRAVDVFTFSVRAPSCGQTSECSLPTECNKCLLCVSALYAIVNLADH